MAYSLFSGVTRPLAICKKIALYVITSLVYLCPQTPTCPPSSKFLYTPLDSRQTFLITLSVMAITDSTVPFCLEQCPILYQLYGKNGTVSYYFASPWCPILYETVPFSLTCFKTAILGLANDASAVDKSLI